MSARPRPRPWRKIIIGAHLPKGASAPVHAGTAALLTFGVAIRTWIGSVGAVFGAAMNAPVAGLIASNVLISTSRISSMLLWGSACSTPNLVNASVGVDAATAPGAAVVGSALARAYGSAASPAACDRIVWVWNVYAIATFDLSIAGVRAASAANTGTS